MAKRAQLAPISHDSRGLDLHFGSVAADRVLHSTGTASHLKADLPCTRHLVFRAILGLLMDFAVPASLGAFVLAGMRLRSDRGMNFEASGGFLKWLFWGCFLLSLPGISHWLVNESVRGAAQLTIAGATRNSIYRRDRTSNKRFRQQLPRGACGSRGCCIPSVQGDPRPQPRNKSSGLDHRLALSPGCPGNLRPRHWQLDAGE